MKFYSNREDSISPVLGVVLIVIITIILAAILSLFAFSFSDSLSQGRSTAAVTVDQGNLRIDSMGTSEKILVKRNNKTFELTSAGEKQNLIGGEKIIAVGDNGGQSVLKTITEEQVIDSGGEIYKDPSTISKDDVQFISEGNLYKNNSKVRLVGTKEKMEVSFTDKYDPDDFTYDWGQCCYDWYDGEASWGAEITENGNTAEYKYTSRSGVPFKDDSRNRAAPEVQITDKSSGNSVSISMSKFLASNPIQEIDLSSQSPSYYSGGDDRIISTTENWSVISITEHSRVDTILTRKSGYNPPQGLSDYTYSWNYYRESNEAADATVLSSNNQDAEYKYDVLTGNHINGADNARVKVSISIPGIDKTQTKYSNAMDIEPPINSATLSGNLSDSIRNVTDTEKWEITNINLHNKVDDVLGSNTPQNLSDYTYSQWDYYRETSNSWKADFNVDDNKNYVSYYTYTRQSTYDVNGANKGTPVISIQVPGINQEQTYTTSHYRVEPE